MARTGRQRWVEDGYYVLGKGLREIPVFDKARDGGGRRRKEMIR
jgi:hypothetical protein